MYGTTLKDYQLLLLRTATTIQDVRHLVTLVQNAQQDALQHTAGLWERNLRSRLSVLELQVAEVERVLPELKLTMLKLKSPGTVPAQSLLVTT